jgi:hypothetical protein
MSTRLDKVPTGNEAANVKVNLNEKQGNLKVSEPKVTKQDIEQTIEHKFSNELSRAMAYKDLLCTIVENGYDNQESPPKAQQVESEILNQALKTWAHEPSEFGYELDWPVLEAVASSFGKTLLRTIRNAAPSLTLTPDSETTNYAKAVGPIEFNPWYLEWQKAQKRIAELEAELVTNMQYQALDEERLRADNIDLKAELKYIRYQYEHYEANLQAYVEERDKLQQDLNDVIAGSEHHKLLVKLGDACADVVRLESVVGKLRAALEFLIANEGEMFQNAEAGIVEKIFDKAREALAETSKQK